MCYFCSGFENPLNVGGKNLEELIPEVCDWYLTFHNMYSFNFCFN